MGIRSSKQKAEASQASGGDIKNAEHFGASRRASKPQIIESWITAIGMVESMAEECGFLEVAGITHDGGDHRIYIKGWGNKSQLLGILDRIWIDLESLAGRSSASLGI